MSDQKARSIFETVLFGVIGVAMLIAGLFCAIDERQFIREAVRVPGEVTKLNAGGSHPEVTFTTLAGGKD